MSAARFSRQIRAAIRDRTLAMLGPSGQRVVKFALVGIAGVGVNSALLALLVEVGQLPPAAAGALATEGAVLSNFILHDHWTFRGVATDGGWTSRALRYNLTALGGMLITVVVLALLTTTLHVFYLLANLFAVGAGVVWNYTLSCRFAWTARDVARSPDSAPSQPPWSPTLKDSEVAYIASRR